MNGKENRIDLEKTLSQIISSEKTLPWFKTIISKDYNDYSPSKIKKSIKRKIKDYKEIMEIMQLKYEIKRFKQLQKIKNTYTSIKDIANLCASDINNGFTLLYEDIKKQKEVIKEGYSNLIKESNDFKNRCLEYISDYKKPLVKATKHFKGKEDSNIIDIPKKDINEINEKTVSSPKKPFYKRPITYFTASLAAAIIAGGLTIGYYTTDLNKKNSVVPTPKQAVEEVINEANALLAQKDLYIELAAAQDKFSKLVEPEKEYNVQKGDSLIKIGAKYDRNIYKKINEWCKKIGKQPLFPNYVNKDGSPVFDNDIKNPNNLEKGDKIDITYLQEEAIKNYETEKASLKKKIERITLALNDLNEKNPEPIKSSAAKEGSYKLSNATGGLKEEKSVIETGLEIGTASIDSLVNAILKIMPSSENTGCVDNNKTNYYAAAPSYIALKQSNITGEKPVYNAPEFAKDSAKNSDIQMINDYFNISADKKTVKSINKEYSADIYSVLKSYNINWTRTAAIKDKKLDRILNSAYLKNEEGFSVRNISEKLGISKSTVYSDLKEYNSLISRQINNAEQINKEKMCC